jgi:D-aminopeptidase
MQQEAQSLLSRTVHSLPSRFKGPGGAIAIVKNGDVIVRHAWGYSDLARRIEMTSETVMPICSISKQFTCAILLDLLDDISQLNPALAAYLPTLQGRIPTIEDLCNNQSGLRDYPVLSVLCGADPEGDFRPEDARKLISRARSTQFEPGTEYSYSNSNFHILADLLQQHAQRSLGDLLHKHVFQPANMRTARYEPESSEYAADCIGYEGNTELGFLPAVHRSHWMGDAGISGSLEDLIAWEQFIDRTRDDPNSLYRRISVPQTFSDGSTACYGFGLSHVTVAGIKATGHSGGIRGWRLRRLHATSERLSVVVMFNHQQDAGEAADLLMAAALGEYEPGEKVFPNWEQWDGNYLNDATGLSLSISASETPPLSARFLDKPEPLSIDGGCGARAGLMGLSRDGRDIKLDRRSENLRLAMRPLSREHTMDIEGSFYCEELDAYCVVVSSGGAMHGIFKGFLGMSAAMPIYPIGENVWVLPCPRGIDVGPGDLTLVFHRDETGAAASLTIGCWLARSLKYTKQH